MTVLAHVSASELSVAVSVTSCGNKASFYFAQMKENSVVINALF